MWVKFGIELLVILSSSESHTLNKDVIHIFPYFFYIFPMWNKLVRDMPTEVHFEFCEQRRSESNPLLMVVS